uniref:Uncharacterized protein n=1 Tax=Eptatretus burgeri TaxID=7764 RepID=A0A8C4QRZ9_EPTBU
MDKIHRDSKWGIYLSLYYRCFGVSVPLSVVIYLHIVFLGNDKVYSPQVAMFCGKLNMHLDLETGGWIEDPNGTTSCLRTPADVQSYCQKVYPMLSVVDVSEAEEQTVIHNWCRKGHRHCTGHSHIVLPYRCLVPQDFSYDTLVFLFSHGLWQACGDLVLHSHSVAKPCGDNGFRAVDFVCCPSPPSSITTLEFNTRYYVGNSKRCSNEIFSILASPSEDWGSALQELRAGQEREVKHLVEAHQARVEALLNDRRRQALQDYLSALEEENPRPSHVLHTLKVYLRAERKDIQHTARRFLHLQHADPARATAHTHMVSLQRMLIAFQTRRALFDVAMSTDFMWICFQSHYYIIIHTYLKPTTLTVQPSPGVCMYMRATTCMCFYFHIILFLLQVDEALTPEERHLNKMQQNGYENPTYKFYEGLHN